MSVSIITDNIRLLLREETERLERMLCDWIPAARCVFVGSAEKGLSLSLLAAGVKVGDKVMCGGFVPEHTKQSITKIGAVPVRIDINPNSLNIDPFCVEYVLDKYRRTSQELPKALIATDMFGLPCNYNALTRICGEYGIVLIEDMGGAFGAELDGKHAGSFSRFAVASFCNAEEQDSGVIMCQNIDDAIWIEEWLRPFDDDTKSFVQASYAGQWLKGRLDNMRHRGNIAEAYSRTLRGACRVQQIAAGYVSAYTQFVAVLPEFRNKSEIIAQLAAKDVLCGEFKLDGGEKMSAWDSIMLINARSTCDKLISLPINDYLTEHMARRIGELIISLT